MSLTSSPSSISHPVRPLPQISEEKLTKEEDKSPSSELTLGKFEELVGEHRFHRIASRPEIAIDMQQFDRSPPNKDLRKKLLFAVLDIQKADVEELSGSIKDRFESLFIFNNFDDFKAVLLSDDETQKLTNIEAINTNGKGWIGLVQRVFLTACLHFKMKTLDASQKNETEAASFNEVEVLAAGLADREFQRGAVLHLRSGFFYVDRVFVAVGAYVTVLRDFEEKSPLKIVCRGTASQPGASGGRESKINNLLPEIGTMGVMAIWPHLSEYLRNHLVGSVEILGKSLGGAHAQELAILIEGILGITVHKLMTCCSVGVGKAINQLFAREILEKRSTPFNIEIIRNGGSPEEMDYVPTVGGDHLGKGLLEKCKVTVIYIHSEAGEAGIYPDSPPSRFRLMKKFKESLPNSHCRLMTLRKFNWVQVTDPAQINYHLSIGNHLEPVRKMVAQGMRPFTSGNGHSFTSYYSTQLAAEKSKEIQLKWINTFPEKFDKESSWAHMP